MTLIDKAEALLPCPFCGGGVSVTTTERVGGIVCDAPSECIGSGLLIVFDLEDMETALAAWNRRAIPARGVGVPSTTQPCTWPTCGCTAKGQFCEAPVRWFPQTASAAQAREAALQAERDAPDYRLAPDLQRIADRAKTAPHWDTENDRLAVPDRKPVWPDFIAPPKYDNPDPRWVDPALPDFRLIWKIARECGYAVGLHGSMKRDCDLIAVPWTDEAVLAFDLIYRLCEALHAQVVGPVAGKPHGRLGWILQVDGYVKVIDISVVPRSQDRATPALKRIGTGLYETAFTPSAIRDAALREAALREAAFLGVCECGMTGPCMWGQCKHPLIGEARDD